MGLGLFVIGDLAVRASDLSAHYTDFGVLPRFALLEKFSDKWFISIHTLSGQWQIEAILFSFTAVCAFGLLIGYRTRLCTFLVWFLTISLQNRNPMVLQGGDVLLRELLFWSLFLPLGVRASIDSCLNPPSKESAPTLNSAGTVAITLQIVMVYTFTVILKWHPIWFTEHTALYYALSIDQQVTVLGKILFQHPWLMKFLTGATISLESLGPVLLLTPIFIGPIRTFLVFAFIGFHLLSGRFLEIGVFPYVCLVTWSVLLPAWFWENLTSTHHMIENRIAKTKAKLLLLPRLERAWRHFLISNKNHVEKNREGFFARILVPPLLAYTLVWNLTTVPGSNISMPQNLTWIGRLARLDQVWGMFAPFPLLEDGWYVAQGELKNGATVDVLHDGRDLNWDKPELISQTYPNDRWRKYMMNLWQKNNSAYRQYYGQYLCRTWNVEHPQNEQLAKIELDYILEKTLPDYVQSNPQKVTILKQNCSSK